jgi:uncharacterized membrane protein YsdA (DUF1294 family)
MFNIRSPYIIFTALLLTLTASGMATLYAFSATPNFLSYLLASTVSATFLMGVDKLQAYRNNLRVPEQIIYISAFLGGTIGIFVGMWLFRHKTKKPKFLFFLTMIIIFQVAISTQFDIARFF